MSIFKSSFRWYAITQAFPYNGEQLQQALDTHHHTTVGSRLDTMTWCSPYGADSPLWVHEHGHCLWLCAKRSQRILPATVIKQQVEDKIRDIESKEMRELSKRERFELKEDTYNQLLGQAFVKQSHLYAMIDTKANLCFINTSQARLADMWSELLHKTFGNLGFIIPKTQTKPTDAMTQWVHEGQGPFGIERHCELQQMIENGSKIRFSNIELNDAPIEELLQSQHVVTKMGLKWQDKIVFTLNQDHTISQMKSLESLQAERDEAESAESAQAQLAADFAIESDTLTSLTEAVIESLGGLSIETTVTQEEEAFEA